MPVYPSSHTGPAGMSAEELAQYKNDLAFSGIDAQITVNLTPEEVGEEVRRVGMSGAQHSYISAA